ncbi:MAG TPA: TetR/AcrR family transcriptional regulator [Solirubrobacterales bacterium]|jgi:AcrR family transcriptional regulator|nr:TetR/AcrR family transcriptional regulator [Solirubrobacterales bacterium]
MESPGPLREVRSWEEVVPDRGSDADVLEAMLLTAGELGYAKATVREVTSRARITEDRFHRHFGGKEACFARAYGDAAARLERELLDTCAMAPDWKAGFEAALAELLRYVAEQPLLARALLIEVKSARGEAWAKHQEVVERLTAAIDSARQQPGARPNSSPMTAGFVVGAIEESLCIEIATGRATDVERLLEDLTRLAFLQLFGG